MKNKALMTAALFDLLWIGVLGFLLLKNIGETKLIIRLISPRYWWLLWMTLSFFIFFFLGKIAALTGIFRFRLNVLNLKRMLFLLIPLILLPFSFDGSLGADALKKRTVSTSIEVTGTGSGESPVSQSSIREEEKSTSPEAPLEDLGDKELVKLLIRPDNYMGKTVSIIGMMGTHPDLPATTGLLFRFFSSCCAADAYPAGLLVPGLQNHESFTEGKWVRLKGTVVMVESNGKEFTGLNMLSLENVPEPPDPIIYLSYSSRNCTTVSGGSQ